MRVGVVARSEDRGLGILTWELCRHLQPDRVLLIDPGDLARGFDQHPDRYPDATVVGWDGHRLDEATVRGWLAGLDVVYTAETPYDWRLFGWAREAGVRSVLHVMPEFYRGPVVGIAPPDAVWAPTTWRLDTLPAQTRVVPVPVAAERFEQRRRAQCETFLHVAGHRAVADRNGTTALLQAVRYLREPCRILVLGQDDLLPQLRAPSHVEVEQRPGGVGDYWRLYDDGDVLLLPRRYGGLSLPAQEAMAAGLALVMSDCEPQRSAWPAVVVACRSRGELSTQCGPVPLMATHPPALAAAIDHLATDPAVVADLSAQALAWADAHSWHALEPLYRVELERVAA